MNDRERLIELIDTAKIKRAFRSSTGALTGFYHAKAVDSDFVKPLVDLLIANGVTIQKYGRCDMCSIGATGTGSIGLYGHGWQVCIRKQGWTYDLVINHCGEQIAIPIDCCPNCGAKMEVK